MKLIDGAIVVFLFCVFVGSSVDKALHYDGFVSALGNYSVVPGGAARLLAPCVIVAELAIGLGLLVPVFRRQAALSAAVLLLCFSCALGVNYFYGNDGACGCWFTFTLGESQVQHIALNLAMASLAASLWWGLRAPEEATACAVTAG